MKIAIAARLEVGVQDWRLIVIQVREEGLLDSCGSSEYGKEGH